MKLRDRASGLDRLRDEADPQRRRLIALGVLTEQLSAHDIKPILVGGAALEFYTAGGYATKDMDLALPVAPEVDAAFASLGFEKEGRYWYHPEFDLLFEAPAPAGLPGEDAPRTEVEIDGLRVAIIGIEDLLIDRLRAWVRWNSDEDGRWTRRLACLYPDRIDWGFELPINWIEGTFPRVRSTLSESAECRGSQPSATRTESIECRSSRSPAFMICPGSSWPTATSTSHATAESLRRSMPVSMPISSSR